MKKAPGLVRKYVAPKPRASSDSGSDSTSRFRCSHAYSHGILKADMHTECKVYILYATRFITDESYSNIVNDENDENSLSGSACPLLLISRDALRYSDIPQKVAHAADRSSSRTSQTFEIVK